LSGPCIQLLHRHHHEVNKITIYCEPEDVRLLVSTTLEDGEIAKLIEQSSAEIDRRVGAQSTTDQAVEKLCALITAYTIKIQRPQSEGLGTRRVEMGVTLELWEKEIERLYRVYHTPIVKASEYASINEDSRFPG